MRFAGMGPMHYQMLICLRRRCPHDQTTYGEWTEPIRNCFLSDLADCMCNDVSIVNITSKDTFADLFKQPQSSPSLHPNHRLLSR